MYKSNKLSIFSRFFFSFLFLVLFSGISEAAVFNCNLGDATCLINSINSANDEVTNPGVDTINLDGSTFTITSLNNDPTEGPNGLPLITSEIVINGNGSTVQRSNAGGTPAFRIFHIDSTSGNLTLNNTIIKGGLSGLNAGFPEDADPGGGILNEGTLSINESIITENMTSEGSPGGGQSGHGGNGGAIANTGQLIIDKSTISNNQTGKGGDGSLNPINGNGARGGSGGAIHNSGDMTISNSTISGNSTGNGGDGTNTGGEGGDGGGIYNSGTGTIATIINTTISNNSVGIGGTDPSSMGADGDGAGIANVNSAGVTPSNSIVADNDTASGSNNCLGTITDGGANLSDDSTCGFSGDNTPNINLGSLLNNGGFTPTHALIGNSAAIDAADNTICSNPPINGVDQRNSPRDASCDIGAYEAVSGQQDFNCTSGDVACLILSINAANDEVLNPGLDTINLDGSTYTLTTENNSTIGPNGLPAIESEIVINGNGSTIERSSAGATPEFRITRIGLAGNLTLNDVVVKGGEIQSIDGGGAIFNEGILTINESIFAENMTLDGEPGGGNADPGGDGGAIINLSSAQLFINNSSIINNKTGSGGEAFFNPFQGNGGSGGSGGGIMNFGTLTISGSTLSGNMTGNGGDGRSNGGQGGNGAGIANFGTLTISNSTVSGNTTGDGADGTDDNGGSGGFGGGIYNSGTGTAGSIINVTVTNNTVGSGGTGPDSNGVDGDGAGLANVNSASLTSTNSIVADNDTALGDNNCLGTITDGGSNLSDDTSCGFSGDNTPNINLDSLADNGGPTETHALLPGSAAIDAGDNTVCSNAPINGVDQRVFTRGANCDIGSYEIVSTGTIEIMKDTNPPGGLGFDFIGTGFTAGCGLDNFTLDDGGSESCELQIGGYTIQEIGLPAGWVVSAIDCLGSSSFNVNVDTLTINLAADEDVICRFTNELPSQAVSSLMEDVEDLQLNEGLENSLLTKLDNAQKSIDSDKINVATNRLNAFINQVDDLNFEGVIADQDADNLIGVTQQVINAL